MLAENVTAYMENPKESIKNFPELISDLSKNFGNKVSIQKSVDFLDTNISNLKLKNSIIKNESHINLSKNIQVLYEEELY